MYAGIPGGVQSGEVHSVMRDCEESNECLTPQKLTPLMPSPEPTSAHKCSRRWDPPRQRMTSDDYYAKMVNIEEQKVAIMKRESDAKIAYFDTKRKYYEWVMQQSQPRATTIPTVAFSNQQSTLYETPFYG